MLLAFILISGLRYKIGSDTLRYMDEYKYYPNLFELSDYRFSETRYDFLWVFFCSTCKTFSDSYFFMQFILAIMINSIYFYFIYKSTNYRFTGLLLYFVFGFLYFNTEILRESLAVAIFLLSIHFFYEKKWIKYYLLAFIAILFHSSAFIVLVFPFFSKVKFNKSFIISLVIIAMFAGVIWTLFNEYIQTFFFVQSVRTKAEAYLNNELYIYNLKGIIYGLFTYVFIPLLFIIFYKKHFNNEIKEAPFVWLYIALGIFIIYNNTIFTRFQNYLFFPFIMFLTRFFIEFQHNKKKVLFQPVLNLSLFVLLVFGKYYNYFKPDITETTYIYQRYFPYHSIITQKTTKERELLDYYW